jgi:hypothetical protein
MSELLATLGSKYEREIGWTFTIFEIATFVLFVAASHIKLFGPGGSAWTVFLFEPLFTLSAAEDGLLRSIRGLDIAIGAVGLFAVRSIHRFVGEKTFGQMLKIKDLSNYMERLNQKANVDVPTNEAVRLYEVRKAEKDRDAALRRFRAVNGAGLLLSAIVVIALIDLIAIPPPLAGAIVCLLGITGYLFIQWSAFTSHMRDVLPKVVLAERLKGGEVNYGDRFGFR